MKILVTGAAGFIGSNLCESLLADGHSVVGFDNLSQGNLLNIENFKSHAGFEFLKSDVLNKESLVKAARGCQAIYHLAAFKIPRFGNAYDTLHINTLGTENAIEAAVSENALLIFASTSDVYGKNPHIPFSEEHDLVLGGPDVRRWAYAISKAFDEQMLFAQSERNGLKFSIARFFGGYGPHQNLTWWGGPQSVFINQALDDEPITLHGEGTQTRSFTFINDHVNGLKKMLEVPEAVGQVFNLGNSREISIHDLAMLIWSLIRPGTTPKIKKIPYSDFGKYEDVVRRVPNTAKAHRLLGFTAQWQLEAALPLTIEWQMRRRRQLEEKI